MGDISRRIARLEEHLGEAACVCSQPEHLHAFVVIGKGWESEQIELAEASKQFICPTHGVRSPSLLRISKTDAQL